jgi:hypothetical protein
LTAAASVTGSITTASIFDSSTLVSNPGDFEDHSILPISDYNLETDSIEPPRFQHHAAVITANDDMPQDPFSTPLPAMETDIEAHHVALEAQKTTELEEHPKFRMEQESVKAMSAHPQRRLR